MTFLVTGAAGFIGLNVLEHLLAAGRTVVGFDRNRLPVRAEITFAALPGTLHFIQGSIESQTDITAAFATAPVACVIHCAVITAGTQREAADPEIIVSINVQGAVAALIAAARFGAKRFVYLSSGAVYGYAARDALILDEDTLAPQPINLYAATKRAVEILLPSIARLQCISLVSARLGTVYGPWEYNTGVRDTLSPMLQSLEQLRRGEPVILSTGHRADYIYSRDVAAGLARLAEAEHLPRGLYNLGSGTTTTAAEWCAVIAKLRPEFEWREATHNETPNVLTHTLYDRPAMNVSHINRDLGFSPRFNLAAAAEDYLSFNSKDQQPTNLRQTDFLSHVPEDG